MSPAESVVLQCFSRFAWCCLWFSPAGLLRLLSPLFSRQQETSHNFLFNHYFLPNFCEFTNVWGQRVRGETWTWWEVHPYNTSSSLAVARQQHWDMTVLLLGPSFWMEPANSSLDRSSHLNSCKGRLNTRPLAQLILFEAADGQRQHSTQKSCFLLVVFLDSISHHVLMSQGLLCMLIQWLIWICCEGSSCSLFRF